MGLFKKDPLKEIFEDYEREDFEDILEQARAISQNDPEVVEQIDFALSNPKEYLKKNTERFDERGIDFDDKDILDEFEPEDLLFLAMGNELEAHGYSIEVDYKCGLEDFFGGLEQLKTYDLIADVIPIVKTECLNKDDVDVWIEKINAALDGKAYVLYNDIDSDSYPLIIVTPETFKLLNGGDEDQTSERNEIDNRDLKMNLADTALGLLVQGEDYGELANTKCEFGYLFDIDDHGIEALFKLTTDKTIAYFAAQGDKLMRLNFNEELFNTTVDGFLDMHG